MIPFNASACPRLSGRYAFSWDDGTTVTKIQQSGCNRVEITLEANRYEDIINPATTRRFIPDGLKHKGLDISRWVGNRLEIGKAKPHEYYRLSESGDLLTSDGQNYPQCSQRPCESVGKRFPTNTP